MGSCGDSNAGQIRVARDEYAAYSHGESSLWSTNALRPLQDRCDASSGYRRFVNCSGMP
jgi:hypothetical protein